MQQQTSAIGVSIFRELDGSEMAAIFAHDLEQAIINMLATDEFKQKAIEAFLKTGRFGAGACYPVVVMQGRLQVKVYASVESYRSKEKMPPPFELVLPEIQTGEMKTEIAHWIDCPVNTLNDPAAECTCDARSATELVTEAEVTTSRVIGESPANAVDRARVEVGIVPLTPQRTAEGAVVNLPGRAMERAEDYEARLRKRQDTIARAKALVAQRRAAKEAEAATAEQRLRSAQEAEARNVE